MKASRVTVLECEGGCEATFVVRSGDKVALYDEDLRALAPHAAVSLTALGLTAVVTGNWSAFSTRDTDGTFVRYDDGKNVQVGRLARMLFVCPACAGGFLPPLSEKAARELGQQVADTDGLVAAIGRLEAELAALKARVAS